jgi:hypothetical protein
VLEPVIDGINLSTPVGSPLSTFDCVSLFVVSSWCEKLICGAEGNNVMNNILIIIDLLLVMPILILLSKLEIQSEMRHQ